MTADAFYALCQLEFAARLAAMGVEFRPVGGAPQFEYEREGCRVEIYAKYAPDVVLPEFRALAATIFGPADNVKVVTTIEFDVFFRSIEHRFTHPGWRKQLGLP